MNKAFESFIIVLEQERLYFCMISPFNVGLLLLRLMPPTGMKFPSFGNVPIEHS